MLCPYCEHSDTKVIDSRDSGDGIRRRRECLGCDRRFTTYERVQMRSVMVVKRDGRREEFEREKLFASLSQGLREEAAAGWQHREGPRRG